MTVYDKQEFYKEEIANKVSELKLLCMQQKIPYYMAFAVANNEEDTEYVTEALIPFSNNIQLKRDRFPDYINIGNGFTTTPYVNTIPEIDIDMINMEFEDEYEEFE